MKALLISGLVIGTLALQGQGAPKTVLDGAYTDAQAMRGEATYSANCARCHRDTLEGNAEALSLVGTRFMESWRDDTLDGLFTHMRTRMPRRPGGEPGSLSEATYLDILAYIIKVNTYPAGSSELTAQTVKEILLVGKDGPRPLATNALVQVVGCFKPGPKDVWTLVDATEPARTRDAEQITADEVKSSASRPLGMAAFGLRNVPDFRPDFAPEKVQGQKVLIKGALTRQPKNDRIYVTALETVASACSP
jgi:mono/diheme cytochrome c family protein